MCTSRYIAAAVFAGGGLVPLDFIGSMLDYIGPALLVLSIISLAIGAAYLILAEIHTE
jgi:hypothetical protein